MAFNPYLPLVDNHIKANPPIPTALLGIHTIRLALCEMLVNIFEKIYIVLF